MLSVCVCASEKSAVKELCLKLAFKKVFIVVSMFKQ
jgi:hypothetical protein